MSSRLYIVSCPWRPWLLPLPATQFQKLVLAAYIPGGSNEIAGFVISMLRKWQRLVFWEAFSSGLNQVVIDTVLYTTVIQGL